MQILGLAAVLASGSAIGCKSFDFRFYDPLKNDPMQREFNIAMDSGNYFRYFDKNGKELETFADAEAEGEYTICIYDGKTIENSRSQKGFYIKDGKVIQISESSGEDYSRGVWKITHKSRI